VNLVCDEGVESSIVAHLREQGHEVLYIAELDPSISDDAVLAWADDAHAPLITNDKDFGELVFRQRLSSPGVVLVRLPGLSNARKAQLVVAAVDQHGSELTGAFTVISPGRVRVRKRIPTSANGDDV